MAKRRSSPSALIPLDPTRVPVTQLAEMLTAYNDRAHAKAIRADLKEGAPVNEDGTIDILAYAAWLHRETVK